jgi:hypothetical protein
MLDSKKRSCSGGIGDCPARAGTAGAPQQVKRYNPANTMTRNIGTSNEILSYHSCLERGHYNR